MFSRSPASISKMNDFSELSGNGFLSAAKKRVVGVARQIQSVPSAQMIGIQLGNFVLKNQNREKIFACTQFSKLILEFEAEDAKSAHPPVMTVETVCREDRDVNYLETIWLPVKKILREPAGDGEFIPEGSNLKLTFKDLGSDWPTSWKLRELRLIAKDPGTANITIEKNELSRYLDAPFLVKF